MKDIKSDVEAADNLVKSYKKLSDEKKIIDNTDYPVSKLDSLLSSYGN